MNWEYMWYWGKDRMSEDDMKELSKLGKLRWEVCGVVPAANSSINEFTILLKRSIENPERRKR